MQTRPTIHIAIPAMNEAEWLPHTIERIKRENTPNTMVWVCVNQPESYRDIPEKHSVCKNNADTLRYLRGQNMEGMRLIDHSSPGKGWKGKQHGVGQARKVLMDAINNAAGSNDLIISMDADTVFDPGYFQSVRDRFSEHPHAMALSNPYYHKLSGDPVLNRAMLRYEIYMRHYAINMWRIGSPYNFTALGSSIALPVRAYRKAGGITAKKSGEDFYFLQKLRKTGWVCNYNTHLVYPATRYSDRVFFGTGPALIRGSRGDWQSYPVYSHTLFNRIRKTYECFPRLYDQHVQTPMSPFLSGVFKESDPFRPLRKNSTSRAQFVRACHEKIDGLRLLQFLKAEDKKMKSSNEEHLAKYLESYHEEVFQNPEERSDHHSVFTDREAAMLHKLSFSASPLSLLDKIRNILRHIEQRYQKQDASCARLSP